MQLMKQIIFRRFFILFVCLFFFVCFKEKTCPDSRKIVIGSDFHRFSDRTANERSLEALFVVGKWRVVANVISGEQGLATDCSILVGSSIFDATLNWYTLRTTMSFGLWKITIFLKILFQPQNVLQNCVNALSKKGFISSVFCKKAKKIVQFEQYDLVQFCHHVIQMHIK